MAPLRLFKSLLVCMCLLGAYSAALAQPRQLEFPSSVTNSFSRKGLASSDWSAMAIPLEPFVKAKTTAFQHRPEDLGNPASVVKIFTTGLALERLGSRYRYKTDFMALDNPVDGVLDGSLYIQGSGDPVLLTTDLWTSLRKLRTRGLRVIRGDVVLSRGGFGNSMQSDFNGLVSSEEDFDEAMYRAYHAQPDPLLLNHGAMYLSIDVDGNDVRVRSDDAPANWAFVSELTPKKGRCYSWKNQLNVSFKQVGEDVLVTLSGDYPVRCGSSGLPIRIPNQDWLWASWIKQIWSELGGVFEGKVRQGETPEEAIVLLSHLGPELNRIIADINKWSSNVMARHLELTVTPADSSFDQEMQNWLKGLRIDTGGWFFENGSGLARNTRVSAKGTAEYLTYFASRADFPDFLASLPRAGADGTVYRRLRSIDQFGYFKTGSLSGVRTIAGYTRAKSGQMYAVTIFVNGYKAYEAWAGMEKLISFLYENG